MNKSVSSITSPYVVNFMDAAGNVVLLPDIQYVDYSILLAKQDCKIYSDQKMDLAVDIAQTYADTVVTNYLETLIPVWPSPIIKENTLIQIGDKDNNPVMLATREYALSVGSASFASSKVVIDSAINKTTQDLTALILQECGSTLIISKEYTDIKHIESKSYTDNHKWTYSTILDFEDGVKKYVKGATGSVTGLLNNGFIETKLSQIQTIDDFANLIFDWKQNQENLNMLFMKSENDVFSTSVEYNGPKDIPAGSVFLNEYDLVNGQLTMMCRLSPFLRYDGVSKQYDFFDSALKNIKDPIDLKDAANKKFVDDKIQEAEAYTDQKISDIVVKGMTDDMFLEMFDRLMG